MIELTDDMRRAVKARMGIPDGAELDPWMEAALEDVLALVERDNFVGKRIPLRCGAIRSDGVTCQRSPEHGGQHAWSLDGELVKW